MTYYELNSIYGHDTFLLDLNGVGAGVKVSHVISNQQLFNLSISFCSTLYNRAFYTVTLSIIVAVDVMRLMAL